MANVTYVVKRGDTLTSIASKYNTTVSNLVKLNNIANPNKILVGETLIISGTAKTTSPSTTSTAKVTRFGAISTNKKMLYATWDWTKDHTDYYQVYWGYTTNDGFTIRDKYEQSSIKQSTYSIPDHAVKVVFMVKPVAKKKKVTVNKKTTEQPYWTSDWSTKKIYVVPATAPDKPSAPTIKIEDYKLTATMENLDIDITEVEFVVTKDDETRQARGTSTVKLRHAEFTCTISAGHEYKARCKVKNKKGIWSEWSDYSGNETTIPNASKGFKTVKALSSTSVYLDWYNVSSAETYEIEYTTQKRYFDSSNEVKSMSVDATVGHAEVTGMETGETYYFRIRAVNAKGESAWVYSDPITIGRKPAAPTTWSSTTTVITGEPLTLYWVHNSEDNSAQTFAELELNIGGLVTTQTIKTTTPEEEDEQTYNYTINTSSYTEGTKIQWRVRTAGITKEYSDWSIERSIDIYAPPTVNMSIANASGTVIDTLTSFPFKILATTEPITQSPIGYHISITSNDSYETVDDIGNEILVGAGEVVYSKFFDITTSLKLELSAKDISLKNNISYTVVCTAAMNSGLSAEMRDTFTVSWSDTIYEPNAQISIDTENYTAYIGPYCDDGEGNLVSGMLLSVYRREFDGGFTELIKDVENTGYTFVTDPHPALDYARYRIVARDIATGTISYYDVPGIPVGGVGAIIQWDENWSDFDRPEELELEGIEYVLEEPSWSGSMIKLPYNVDISDANKPDVELIEYIGRSHPVSYYGTQVGSSSTWNIEIPKTDKDTLYALRRLSKWMGNAYVRESSGSGYWANITVSISQKHCDVTIPVTLGITRVEGGM